MSSGSIARLLAPVDFSEASLNALDHAAFIARQFSAELFLLHVIEQYYPTFNIVVPEFKITPPTGIADIVEDRLNEIADGIREDYGLKVTVLSLTAHHVSAEIVKVARENDMDIIVMGTHGVSGFKEFFVGSTAYRVVTLAACPVITIREDIKSIGFKNILLPVDSSEYSFQKVPLAARFALKQGATISLLCLYGNEDAALMEKAEDTRHALAEMGITCMVNKVQAKNYATAVIEQAVKIKAGLIVIMTEQDENYTGLFLGPFAQQLVNHSSIPVLSIRPNKSF